MWTSLTISCFIACHCLLWREAARRRSFYHCLYEHLPCLFEEELLCARPLLSLVHIRIIHCLGEELLWEFLDIVYAGVDHWLFWRGITIPTIDCVSKGLLSGDLVAPSVRSFVVCVEEDLLRDPPPSFYLRLKGYLPVLSEEERLSWLPVLLSAGLWLLHQGLPLLSDRGG